MEAPSPQNKEKAGKEKAVWDFLSSVRLAVFLLITLAITSIAGTLLPQGEPLQFYLERYGPNVFQIIKWLHLYDTYHSWWFLLLLTVFSINLIVCTLKRFPTTLKLYRRDSLSMDPERLERMPFKKRWEVGGDRAAGKMEACAAVFREMAGRLQERNDLGGGRIFLSERGRWSYWGLYGLHSSILVIFIGALVGLFFGFKGHLMLFEGASANRILNQKTGKDIPLGFTVRCNDFFVEFYDSGAPKEFRSEVTILEQGREVLNQAIRVNEPLSYSGITFYQATYQAVPEVIVKIAASDGRQRSFSVPAFERVSWPEERLTLGVMQYMPSVHGAPAARVWVGDERGPQEAFWVLKGQDKEIKRGNGEFTLTLVDAQERYMTGLQVKKDPGVWIVWIGCTSLILGFIVVFWVPHRRVWFWVGSHGGKTVILLSGQTNKNRMQFEKDFSRIQDALDRCLGERS